MDLEEIANSAVLAASAILRAVVSDSEIQGFLDGFPTYFNTMIALAAVFLLKASTKCSSVVQVDLQKIRHLLRTLLATLKGVTSSIHPRHLLISITTGIESLLGRCGVTSSTCTVEEQDTEAASARDDCLDICRVPLAHVDADKGSQGAVVLEKRVRNGADDAGASLAELVLELVLNEEDVRAAVVVTTARAAVMFWGHLVASVLVSVRSALAEYTFSMEPALRELGQSGLSPN